VVKAIQTENGPRANIEDLGQSLKKLLTDQHLRKSLGKEARKYAVESFSPEVIAKRFLDLIQA
jgi:glycosyltransferase involved in cell wall biosynthesis